MKVSPQLEERQRVRTMGSHELADAMPLVLTWKLHGNRQGPKQHVGCDEHSEEAERSNSERHPEELIVKAHRALVPGEQSRRLLSEQMWARTHRGGRPGEHGAKSCGTGAQRCCQR